MWRVDLVLHARPHALEQFIPGRSVLTMPATRYLLLHEADFQGRLEEETSVQNIGQVRAQIIFRIGGQEPLISLNSRCLERPRPGQGISQTSDPPAC